MNIAARFERFLTGVLALPLLFQVQILYASLRDGDPGTVQCSITTPARWIPSWGAAEVAQDQYSRYIYQWMYWHNDERLFWFRNNIDSTYEPDAFFYNYDGLAYGDRPSGYWNSDLPSPYVDTQASDGSDEKGVTIGSANAFFMRSAVVYYTVTRMVSGAGNSSWTKLSSQRGRRVPSSCYSTNCSFGCDAVDSPNNIPTVPFTSFTSPGCRQYWWEWSATGNQPC